MIVPDRQGVKAWRTRVRGLVRANPALVRLRRRATKRWTQRINPNGLRWVIPLFAFGSGAAPGFPLEILLGAGVWWTLCLMCNRAQQWTAALNTPAGLWIFYHLPLDNARVFAHQRALLLRASVWLAVDWFAAVAGLAVRENRPMLVLLGTLVAATQYAIVPLTAVWLVRLWPRLPYMLGVTGCWFGFFIGPRLPEAVVQPVLDSLFAVTPAGWAAAAFRLAAHGSPWGWALLILLGGVGAVLLRLALDQARRGFAMERVFGYDALDPAMLSTVDPATAESPGAAEVAEATVATVTAVDVALVRERLHAALHQPAGHHLAVRGPLDAAILRTFSRRQRVLADFFRPAGLAWTRSWVTALCGLIAVRLLQFAGVNPLIVAALFCLPLLFALPLFGGHWPGFRAVLLFQQQVGIYSLLPIGFWETSRMILLANLLRVLAGLPLVVVAARYGFVPVPLDLAESFAWSVRVAVAVVAIQPLWIMIKISPSTNDTSARWWLTLLLLSAVGFGLVFLVACGVALFAANSWGAFWAGFAALVFTHLLLATYGWVYRRGVFDLVGRPLGSVR